MASVLAHTADESITVTAPAAKRRWTGECRGSTFRSLALLRYCAAQPRSPAASCAGSGSGQGAERVLRELGRPGRQEVPL